MRLFCLRQGLTGLDIFCFFVHFRPKTTRIRVIGKLYIGTIKVTRKWVKWQAVIVEMEYASLYVWRIRQLCRDRGITVNKLATMSDVKQSTIDNIMRGVTKNPGVKTMHKIALAFNMTLAEFLDFRQLNEYSFEDDVD